MLVERRGMHEHTLEVFIIAAVVSGLLLLATPYVQWLSWGWMVSAANAGVFVGVVGAAALEVRKINVLDAEDTVRSREFYQKIRNNHLL